MLTYQEILNLIPKRSRNTEAQDQEFATLILQAVMEKIDAVNKAITVEELLAAQPFWPHDLTVLPPEELQKLVWMTTRLLGLGTAPAPEPRCPECGEVGDTCWIPATGFFENGFWTCAKFYTVTGRRNHSVIPDHAKHPNR